MLTIKAFKNVPIERNQMTCPICQKRLTASGRTQPVLIVENSDRAYCRTHARDESEAFLKLDDAYNNLRAAVLSACESHELTRDEARNAYGDFGVGLD